LAWARARQRGPVRRLAQPADHADVE
jgi:hypothetical protein